jgi:hypothetical protein
MVVAMYRTHFVLYQSKKIVSMPIKKLTKKVSPKKAAVKKAVTKKTKKPVVIAIKKVVKKTVKTPAKKVVAKASTKKASTKKAPAKKVVTKKAVRKKHVRALVCAPGEQCFWTSDGNVLQDLDQLQMAFGTMADEVFLHHVTKEKNDFADWVESVLEDTECAKALRQAKKASSARTAVVRCLRVYTI